MCVRPCRTAPPILVMLLGLGCATQPEQPLDALLDGLAQEAALAAGSAVTATLLVSAVGIEVCASKEDLWSEVAVGDPAPLSELLSAALGEPVVGAVLPDEDAASGTLTLTGARLLDQDDVTLMLVAYGDGEGLALGATAATDSAVGAVSVDVLGGCKEVGRASGEATWTDATGREHVLRFPKNPDDALIFEGEVPWLPTAGDLVWSASVRSATYSINADDASTVTVLEQGDLPQASWPATVTSEYGSAEAVIPIAP